MSGNLKEAIQALIRSGVEVRVGDEILLPSGPHIIAEEDFILHPYNKALADVEGNWNSSRNYGWGAWNSILT